MEQLMSDIADALGTLAAPAPVRLVRLHNGGRGRTFVLAHIDWLEELSNGKTRVWLCGDRVDTVVDEGIAAVEAAMERA
jgi:hypothetical protein